MEEIIPRVSIGLAVHNGADYIEQAIESILAQTYTNFELIISDNASTDETSDICLRFAENDKRIHYYRNSKNIGGANNANLTFNLSKGEYFCWLAHDDIFAPKLLATCVSILDRDPDVVLCYTMIQNINEKGEQISITSQKKGISQQPYKRFYELSQEDHHCEAIYGLIRSSILRKTRLLQNYTNSDRTFLSRLSLYGKYCEVPEPLFFKRYHPKNTYVNMRARMAWFNPALKGKVTFPYWMQFYDYLYTISRGPIPAREKFLCYLVMLDWFFKHLKNLVGDLFFMILVILRLKKDPYAWRNKNKDLYNWE